MCPKRFFRLLDDLRLVKDGKYGNDNPKIVGGWDGMVGELVRKVIQITIVFLKMGHSIIGVVQKFLETTRPQSTIFSLM